MRLTAHFAPVSEVAAEYLCLPVWEEEPLTGSLAELDNTLGGVLDRLKRSGDLTGKANELTPVLGCSGSAAERLLFVGLGKRAGADQARLHDAAAAAARSLTGKQRGRVAFALPEGLRTLSWADTAVMVGTGLLQGCVGPGLRKSEPARFIPQEVWLVAPPASPVEEIRQGTYWAAVQGEAEWLARELVNTPPCELYPETFAARAQQVAAQAGIECTILDEVQLEAERMEALLGVAQGSDRPPRLVVLRSRRGANGRTLGLIGKGVTFDSGGLSLKTNEQMVDMKCDMAGAATVLAAMQAIALLQIPVNVVGVLALVENLPSGRALKLGDVLRTRSGKTIEVLNTDAEGRLILADALSYAVEQNVDHLVDLATLTGACMVALGVDVAGLMGNHESWCDRVLAAARQAGEKVWPLPMFPHYAELIKSHVADMKNTGGTRYGGAITAAKLLEQFVGERPWAHLDIAGPAWAEHESPARDPGGTGCYVRTLVELARGYGAEAK